MERQRFGLMAVMCGSVVSAAMAGPAPKVIQTTPAANATSVSPSLSEIVVVFDIPVKMNSWSVVYAGDRALPDLAGDQPITFRDNKTCVIKVKLKPDTEYGIGFNSATRQGFKAAEDETPAEPFQLLFRTGGGETPAVTEGPRLVTSKPADGTRDLEPGSFELTLVFSEPMKAGEVVLEIPEGATPLRTIGKPRWTDARTCAVSVMLAPKENYRVGINTGRAKPFISAGDGTPAPPVELTFSTVGAPPLEKGKSGPAGAAKIKYDYQKGDAGRTIQCSDLDVKLHLPGDRTIPIARKVAVNSIEEVLAVQNGRPVEVRRMVSEFILRSVNPETGEEVAAPRLEEGVIVTIDRRSSPTKVNVTQGNAPDDLVAILQEDEFLELLPEDPVKVGDKLTPPRAMLDSIREAFDSSGRGKLDFTLTCTRVGDGTGRRRPQQDVRGPGRRHARRL